VFLFVVTTLAVTVVPALAVPPEITAVGEQDRHPTILFSAPRAASVTVYVASKRDRATDGTFFQENVVATGLLTDSEIQSGEWLDSSRIDPGSYFVMVEASGGACDGYDSNAVAGVTDPSCADGFSSIVRLTIPKPRTKFTVKVDVLRFMRTVSLELTGKPLGENLPYRVCWRQPAEGRKFQKRCRTSSLDGYSWSHDATDSLLIDTEGMARRTTFTWHSRGSKPKRLLSKTIRVY
jgi:hypothetical protein